MSETPTHPHITSPSIYRGPDVYEDKTNVWFMSQDGLDDLVVEQPIDGEPVLKSTSGRPANAEQLRMYGELIKRMANRVVNESFDAAYYDN